MMFSCSTSHLSYYKISDDNNNNLQSRYLSVDNMNLQVSHNNTSSSRENLLDQKYFNEMTVENFTATEEYIEFSRRILQSQREFTEQYIKYTDEIENRSSIYEENLKKECDMLVNLYKQQYEDSIRDNDACKREIAILKKKNEELVLLNQNLYRDKITLELELQRNTISDQMTEVNKSIEVVSKPPLPDYPLKPSRQDETVSLKYESITNLNQEVLDKISRKTKFSAAKSLYGIFSSSAKLRRQSISTASLKVSDTLTMVPKKSASSTDKLNSYGFELEDAQDKGSAKASRGLFYKLKRLGQDPGKKNGK